MFRQEQSVVELRVQEHDPSEPDEVQPYQFDRQLESLDCAEHLASQISAVAAAGAVDLFPVAVEHAHPPGRRHVG